jgi:hypothetical protein
VQYKPVARRPLQGLRSSATSLIILRACMSVSPHVTLLPLLIENPSRDGSRLHAVPEYALPLSCDAAV